MVLWPDSEQLSTGPDIAHAYMRYILHCGLAYTTGFLNTDLHHSRWNPSRAQVDLDILRSVYRDWMLFVPKFAVVEIIFSRGLTSEATMPLIMAEIQFYEEKLYSLSLLRFSISGIGHY